MSLRSLALTAGVCLWTVSVLTAAAQAEQGSHTLPSEPAGMRSIFNGKDLTGWTGDPRLWKVQDGAIRGETTAEAVANGNTFLIWTEGKTGDFDLRLSFRCNDTNNSGVQYRSKRVTEGVKNDWVVAGYQCEIRNEIDFPNTTGFIYDERGTRKRICLVGEKATWEPETGKQVIEQFMDEAEFQKLFRLDEWNDLAIIAKGNHIRHYLNGKLILDFTDNDPKLALLSGVLAVQLHAGKPMWCEYKNVRIADLKK